MRVLLAALALLASSPAAAMDYADYTIALQSESGRKALIAYLDGFGAAIGNYEQHQIGDGRTRRFCQPQGVRLTAELLAGLIDKVTKDQPQLANKATPVPALIWIGLERQFPCPKGKMS